MRSQTGEDNLRAQGDKLPVQVDRAMKKEDSLRAHQGQEDNLVVLQQEDNPLELQQDNHLVQEDTQAGEDSLQAVLGSLEEDRPGSLVLLVGSQVLELGNLLQVHLDIHHRQVLDKQVLPSHGGQIDKAARSAEDA